MASGTANQVVTQMPTVYHVTRNNCQTFCNRLFSRIRIPTTTAELSAGLEDIPLQSRDNIIERRRVDLVRFKILEANTQIPPGLFPFQQPPMTIESVIDASLGVLIGTVLLSAWKQLEQRTHAFLSLIMCLLYLHGNHRALRLLMTAPGMAEVSQSQLDKMIKYLCPRNDAEEKCIRTKNEWFARYYTWEEMMLEHKSTSHQLLEISKEGQWPFTAVSSL